MMVLGEWVLSDNPNDWAIQGAAVFTGVYVWLTYRLMRWTAETARVAMEETRNQRAERILPTRISVDAVLAELEIFAEDVRSGISSNVLRHRQAFTHALRELDFHSAFVRTSSLASYRKIDAVRTELVMLSHALVQLFTDPSGSTLEHIPSRIAMAQAACETLKKHLDVELERISMYSTSPIPRWGIRQAFFRSREWRAE